MSSIKMMPQTANQPQDDKQTQQQLLQDKVKI
jgi:hypothetical protein